MDDKTKQGWQDDKQIDIKDGNELSYAQRKWGCSRADIREAAKATGSRSRRVIYDWLKENVEGIGNY